MDINSEYKQLVYSVLSKGVDIIGRNGKTKVLVNQTLNIDISNDIIPILSLKKIFYKKAFAEFIWMLKGTNNIEYLQKHGIRWWDSWADKDNNLQKSYGYQLRNFNGTFDQLDYVIKELNKKGTSRRAHITLWNPSNLDSQELPCCYTSFNFVKINNQLEMIMNFRSSDVFLGLPYDIIVGSLFAKYIADKTGLVATKLHINLSNAHIYEAHNKQANSMAQNNAFTVPTISIGNFKCIDTYIVSNYKSNEYIKTKIIK